MIPAKSNNVLDFVSNDSVTTTFTTWDTDRFGIYASAMTLNSGYLTLPSGVYFNGDFTVSAWVKPLSLSVNQAQIRLIDFANGEAQDNVFVSISHHGCAG